MFRFRGSILKTKYTYISLLLAVFSGVLLAVSAIPSKAWFLNFVALVPLLFAAQYASKAKRPFWSFMGFVAVTMSVFYLWVGFWILQTANLGFILGILIILPFLLLISPHILLLKKNKKIAPLYLIVAWLSVEYIQNFYELGSPFFNLGHSLGAAPKLIQWYEYTGAAGGTLWILLVNVFLYNMINALIQKTGKWKKHLVFAGSSILLPVFLSLAIYYTYEEKCNSVEVLVVHPSTDNSDVKYRKNIYELMDIYLDIALPHITENTDYVVLPETAITNTGWVEDYNRNLVFQHWFERTAQFPNLKLITGAIAYESIPNVEKIKHYEKIPGIRYSENYKTWYYTYNAALQLEQNRPVQIRVKDGLVPFQEYAPYPIILPKLSPAGIDFQFSSREKNQHVFTSGNGRKTAALICYETVYSNLFAKAARQGAEAFFVLLNEGWYEAPKVPRQFLQLSVIRAIENRRSVAHSSNMGISAVISQRGELIAKTESKEVTSLKNDIILNKRRTASALLKNHIELIALIISITLILTNLRIVITDFIRRS
jgi:apolipoprotein N-acyltransferase